MKHIIAFAIAKAFVGGVSAQTDTTIGYIDKYEYKCDKNNAVYYTKLFRDGQLWRRKSFIIQTDKIKYDYTFLDKDCKKVDGKVSEYNEDGILKSQGVFIQNKIISATYFSPEGKKVGYAEYDTSGKKITIQQGWDENGKEIIGYISTKDAEFAGKQAGWIKFLQRTLNADVPNKNGAPVGKYSAMVGFFIETDGSVSDIKILEDPGYGTGNETLRVLRLSKGWSPAIENNKIVKRFYRQQITFQVSNY
ncbi:MAG: hypothetical protein H7068_03945 [Pedobacter sp.]|nr:hypothetical protein [Chitinophagaceae bacterium]